MMPRLQAHSNFSCLFKAYSSGKFNLFFCLNSKCPADHCKCHIFKCRCPERSEVHDQAWGRDIACNYGWRKREGLLIVPGGDEFGFQTEYRWLPYLWYGQELSCGKVTPVLWKRWEIQMRIGRKGVHSGSTVVFLWICTLQNLGWWPHLWVYSCGHV